MARTVRRLLAGALSSFAAASVARAADPLLAFSLAALPPDRAALAVGLRAGVSVGVAVRCHGPAASLSGRYGVHTALDYVLARSDCRAVWLDASTARIERRPPAPTNNAAVHPPPPSSDVAEVIVTASKRELLAESFPGSATVASSTELASVHARSTADLRLLASGVTVTNLGPGRDKILLRGLSDGAFTGRTQSTVGLYWNGAPTTYNAPDPDLRLVDISSVEVLRGPQGTLYGAGALGGVVDVLPHAPELGSWSAAFDAEGSDTVSGGPSAAVEGVINAPLPGGRAAGRLVLYDNEEGGWIGSPLIGAKDANHVQQAGGRASVLVDLAAGWTVTLGDTYQDIYSRDTQYTTDGPASLSRDTQVREPHDNDFEQAYVDLRGHGGWGELNSLSAFTDHDFTSRYDATAAAADFGGSASLLAFDDDTRIRLSSEELNYRAPWRGPVGLLLGAYGSYGDEVEATHLAPVGGPDLYAEARTDTLVDAGLFGEASWSPIPRLTLTAGLRLSYAQRRTLSRLIQAGAEAPFAGDTTTRERSPKLAADYAFARGVHAYALVSRGYRAGGFNTAGLVGHTVFTPQGGGQPNRFFAPDDLWNYELGLKLSGWRGRFEARSALYYDIWRHLQADQFLSSGLPYVANVGTAHVEGWEWEVSARLYRALKLQLGALFTSPDLRNVDPSFPSGRSDFTLPGVARRSLNGDLSYLWALGGERTLELDAAALYVGHSYLLFGPQGETEMGAYLDGRLQAVVHAGPWRMGLTLANPANNRGDTFAFGNPFSLNGPAQRTPLRPRTVTLRVEHDF